jgi:hypothetical protein
MQQWENICRFGASSWYRFVTDDSRIPSKQVNNLKKHSETAKTVLNFAGLPILKLLSFPFINDESFLSNVANLWFSQ